MKELTLRNYKEPWLETSVQFLGAENYVLGTKTAKVQFLQVKGGFSVKFLEPLFIEAQELMGKKVRKVTVTDIVLDFAGLKISIATIRPEAFPRTYTEGQGVGLTA